MNFAFYSLGFVIPFLTQIFQSSFRTVIILNCMCMFQQLFNFYILMRATSQKKSKYFKYWVFYLELFQIVLYTVYFILRCNHTGLVTPEVGKNDDFVKSIMGWFVIHTVLMVLVGQKLTFLLKASTRFSKVIDMIHCVNIEVIPFIIYLILWMIFTSLLFLVAGIIIYDEEWTQE